MGAVDPVRDREVIEFELALSDLAAVEKRLDKVKRASRTGEKEALAELPALEKAHAALAEGRGALAREAHRRRPGGARAAPAAHREARAVRGQRDRSRARRRRGAAHRRRCARRSRRRDERAEVVPFSARIEAELAELPAGGPHGLSSPRSASSRPGLDRLIRAGYHLMGLQTYFTAGEQEVRAWTIHRGDAAPAAAGVIHTDFERGFIRAETVSVAGLRRERRMEGRAREGRGAAKARSTSCRTATCCSSGSTSSDSEASSTPITSSVPRTPPLAIGV